MAQFFNRNVYYFIKIVSVGSFKEAARLLNLSQPALSISIRNFEEEIGCPLFLREKKNASLTPKGHELYKKLVEMEMLVTNDTDTILKGRTVERIRFGSIPWFAETHLLPLLQTKPFGAIDHDAQYFIRPAGILRDAVVRGWLDIAFINWPQKPSGVMFQALHSDPAVIGGLKSKFKHIEKARSLSDLENERWIHGEGRGINWTDSIAWDKSGFVISDVYSVRFLVLGGYGIYEFQLAYFSKKEQSQLAIANFPSRFKDNRIYAIWRSDLKGKKKSLVEQVVATLSTRL